MSLPVGAKLGPYEIGVPIGAGGMGEVYRARDTRLDRTVAIKVPALALSGDHATLEREARAVAALNHPHICAIHDVGWENGEPFLVMEHLQGETLAARLSRGLLPAHEVIGYGIQIAEALDHAHRHGVVHRDLKPANINADGVGREGARLRAGHAARRRISTIRRDPARPDPRSDAPRPSAARPGAARPRIYVDDLERSAPRKLVASSLSAAFAAPGHLLFSSDTLMAATFDWTKQQLTGEPFPLAPSVAGSSNFFGAFSAAETGVLVYATSAASSELVWIDRAGKQLGRVAPPADYVDFRLSPDDTQLAVAEVDPQSHRPDIRVLDLARGAKVRLTDDAATDASPVWSADGQQIVFRSNRSGLNDLYQKAANGAGPDTLLLQSPSAKYPTDSLPAGRGLVFHTYERETGSDIWLAPAEGAQPAPLVKTKFHQMQGQVSSDGEWLAYASLESGQAQVYVRSLVDATRRWQVSAGGGTDPRWREDARELYYISADSWMTGATITAGAPAAPKRMFQVAAPPPRDPYLSSYDVTGDGSRFLMKVAVQDVTSAPLHVVANWLGARRGP